MYKKLSVAEWISVPSNPIQRNTERHAARAKHLLVPQASHQFVFAAELPGGNLIKLDGHTRALMWKRKDVEAPPFVWVATIPVKDKKAAEELYKTFDSKSALETTRDKVSGAFNRHNFQPKSGLLQTGHIVSALRIATAVLLGASAAAGTAGVQENRKNRKGAASFAVDEYAMVDEWSYELHALDDYALRPAFIKAGTMAAFLISLRRHGTKVLPFWTGVFGNEGDKHGRQMDAIQATSELLIRRRGHGGGGSSNADLCSRCLGGVAKWLEDAVMTRVPSPIDTTNYLKGYEHPSERLIKAVDRKAA